MSKDEQDLYVTAETVEMKMEEEEDHQMAEMLEKELWFDTQQEYPFNENDDASSIFNNDDREQENLFMHLIDSSQYSDPFSVNTEINPQQPQKMQCEEEKVGNDDDGFSFITENSELTMIFFEWLKQNRDNISAQDMRSIKLKRSTIESASKRLGSTREGNKQLLTLILDWVQQHQLQRKQGTITASSCGPQSPNSPNPNPNNPNFGYNYQLLPQNSDSNPSPNPNNLNFGYNYQLPLQNPNSNPSPNPNCPNFGCNYQVPHNPNNCNISPASPSMPTAPLQLNFDGSTTTVTALPGYCNGDPYSNPTFAAPPANQVVNGISFQHSAEYTMMDHNQPWAPSSFVLSPQISPVPPHQSAVYGHQHQVFDPNGEGSAKLGSSATREARKKRMAHQRRVYSHHHHHNSNSKQPQSSTNTLNFGDDSGANDDQNGSPGSWSSWSPVDASDTHSGDRVPQIYQRQVSSEKGPQQGSKTENNLKFLLQKVLKQSDVGNLGRIVLPKKEAESYLPELGSRDAVPIDMEDIGSSRVWNMRYRYWPNNQSRMYLLENTGDFVRVNGLQEGDFIVIYSDTKCGKYLIRGVKVRQPGSKLEGKNTSRRNARYLSFAGNSSSLAMPRSNKL